MAAEKPPGTLYLIPVTLGNDSLHADVLPAPTLDLARRLEVFVVEREKTARSFLASIKTQKPVRELTLLPLNEHTTDQEVAALLTPLLSGSDVGLMSEAGCPGIADPGAQLVTLAHRQSIPVKPLIGPSSILLALMASGLNGQNFCFLGYLPTEKSARISRLKALENHSKATGSTQIFIETPYRNQHLIADIIAHCQATTQLCLASNLTLDNEIIRTQSVQQWKKYGWPDLHRQPTVFLLRASR